MVLAASYRRRLRRRSTACWMRPAGGLEHSGHGQGGAGDRPTSCAGVDPTKKLSGYDDHDGVDRCEHDGQQRVRQGPTDQPVDVIQPVPEDGDTNRDGITTIPRPNRRSATDSDPTSSTVRMI